MASIPEAATPLQTAAKSLSPGAEAWRRLRRNPVAVISGLFIVVLVLVAICAPLFTHYAYDFLDTKNYNSLPAPPDSHHVLGTDGLGEDILSRLLYGARVSLGVSLIVVIVEVLVGVTLGLTAGFYGGKTDVALMRLTDVMFAFPDILLAIMLSAIVRSGSQALPPWSSFLVLFFALGIVGWPGLARLVRGQALALREKEYIEAARSIGVKNRHIIFRHLFPNLLSPIIVQVTQDIAGVILAESTLSFLGLGVQPPYPSWGRMIEDALVYKETHPLLLLAPGLLLALTVMAFNFFGDALRDALDPRLRE
ncbi:MAG: ABC-type dipeptide/oligopeptide/nickel transport system, permease component [Chthonomonadaceae bacterium]|nr:ABC-type dipeptide/oligopeptide/nickel transport system, permease component [Chthonomonadaceae bacterium]